MEREAELSGVAYVDDSVAVAVVDKAVAVSTYAGRTWVRHRVR
jgi:hypothetical protein